MAAPASSARSPLQSEMGITLQNTGIAPVSTDLPSVAQYQVGTDAYTTDLGPVYSNGVAWVPYANTASLAAAGVPQDGVTDATAAFTTLLSKIGTTATNLVISGPVAISSLTIPSNIQLTFWGGLIKPTGTVTINGAINAGAWQIFDLSAGGSITGTPLNQFCYDEWFGAKSDGTTDCTAAMNACRAFAHGAGDIDIRQLAGTYLITGTVFGIGSSAQSATAPSCYGVGKKRTFWSYPGVATGLKFVGGSGLQQGCIYVGISFKGDANSIGIMPAGVCGFKFIRCGFEDNLVGIQPHNEAASTFTEYVEAQDCDFRVSCLTAIQYKVTSGTNSFNGTGLNNRCTVNIPSGGTAISIGSGCKPYLAALDAQFWTNGSTATLIANASTLPCSFIGKLTFEQNSGSLTLGATNTVYFDGPVAGTGDSVSAGTFIRGAAGVIFSDSTVLNAGSQTGFKGTITTGANTITSAAKTRTRLVHLQLAGTNYDFRYLLLVNHNGYGAAGYASQLWSQNVNNTAGYGGGTFSVSTSGDLIITNAGYPASGVTWAAYEMGIDMGALPGTKQVQF